MLRGLLLLVLGTVLCATLSAGQEPSDGTYMQLFKCVAGSARQQWDLSRVVNNAGDKTIRLKQYEDKCLDISNYGTSNGAQIWLYGCHTDDKEPSHQNQEFTYNTATKQFRSTLSGKCIDVQNNSTEAGSPIQIWDCSGSGNQQWVYNETDSTLRGVASGLCLDAGTNTPWTPCATQPNQGYPFCNMALTPQQRAADLVSRIPVADKWRLFGNSAGSIPSLQIPSYQWWSEALHGVAGSPGVTWAAPTTCATSFPQICTTGASFDTGLWEQIGQVISTEARAFSNAGHAGLTFWTPNLNIFRDPRWGRGQETPGEDPYLTSQYVRHYVYNLQFSSEDPKRLKMSSCCKHYAAYSLENWGGNDRCSFNAVVTQQDIADTYFPAFEACISPAGAAASGIMCSYNAVNGVPSCANSFLLTDTARNKWSFNGYITGDCGAVSCVQNNHHYTNNSDDTCKAVLTAGLDIDCGDFLPNNLAAAVSHNAVSMATVDHALSNLYAVLIRLGLFDPEEVQPYRKIGPDQINTPSAQALALRAAREGLVLLKNEGNALPLSKTLGSIAIIGPNAMATTVMQGNYYGTACSVTSPLVAIKNVISNVNYAQGSTIQTNDQSGFEAACSAAKSSSATVFIGGITNDIEAEGRDRDSIAWPGVQPQLIERLTQCSKGPVILVVMGGGTVDMTAQRDNANVSAIIWAGYPGQAGGQAIADVLFGTVSPAGRLAQTIYPAGYVNQVKMSDMGMRPSSANPGRTYRFYPGPVVYPFGTGLSYTTFTYKWSNTSVSSIPAGLVHKHIGDESSFLTSPALASVTAVVTNTGKVASDCVVLAFAVGPDAGKNGNPIKSLFGFKRIFTLNPGQEATVTFPVTSYDLSYVDKNGGRASAPGDWHFEVEGAITRITLEA